MTVVVVVGVVAVAAPAGKLAFALVSSKSKSTSGPSEVIGSILLAGSG